MEEELYTRLEDYLDNALDATERAAFEAEVLIDPALAAALEHTREARQRLTHQWTHEEADRALSATLREIGREYFSASPASEKAAPRPQSPLTLRRLWPFIAIAACLAGLLFWLFGTENRGASNEKLYAQYRHFPEADFLTRATGDTVQQDLATAETVFNAGRYTEALPLLERALAANRNDIKAHFYIGLCHLELGQYDAATSIFQVLRVSKSAYADEAMWYLALTYLRQGNRVQCAEVLRQLPPDSGHDEEAKALRKQLGQ